MAKLWTTEEIRAAVGHFRNLTLAERKELRRGEWYDYTFARWRPNGHVQTWVTRPGEVSIPAKHGLRWCARFDEQDAMLVGPEPIANGLRKQVLMDIHQASRVRRAVTARFELAKVGG